MRYLTIVLIISFGFVQNFNGQSLENNFLYGNAGFSAGNYIGIETGINFIKDEKISYHLTYYFKSNNTPNKPADYSSGLWGSGSVYNQHHSLIASAGYVIPLNSSKTIRLLLKGGAGLRWSRVASSFEPHYTSSSWFSNKYYTYNYENKYTPELTINPAIEFALSRGMDFLCRL